MLAVVVVLSEPAVFDRVVSAVLELLVVLLD